MKAAGCDFVVLGTIIRETIGTIGESRKTGFSPTFLGSSAAVHRPDPQARRQGDGRPVRDDDGREPLSRRRLEGDQLLGPEVQDEVQRGPDRVLGLRLQRDRSLRRAASKAGPNLRPTASSRRWTR
jgi:hypothetical protein